MLKSKKSFQWNIVNPKSILQSKIRPRGLWYSYDNRKKKAGNLLIFIETDKVTIKSDWVWIDIIEWRRFRLLIHRKNKWLTILNRVNKEKKFRPHIFDWLVKCWWVWRFLQKSYYNQVIERYKNRNIW